MVSPGTSAGQELTECQTEGRPGAGSRGVRPLPGARVGCVEGGSLSFSTPRLERASAFCPCYLLVTWSLQASLQGASLGLGDPWQAVLKRPPSTGLRGSWVALQLRDRHELC